MTGAFDQASVPRATPAPRGPFQAVLVGCGGVAWTWVEPALARAGRAGDLELVGLVDPREEVASALAERYHLALPVFAGLEAALSSLAPTLVLDATPPEAHVEVLGLSAKAGCDVIAEKPLATSATGAARLLEIVEQHEMTYSVMQNRRYFPGFRSLCTAVRSGALGEVATVDIDFHRLLRPGGFRAEMDDPLLLDLAIHHFDALRALLDDEPTSILATSANPAGSSFRGHASVWATLALGSRAVVSYRASASSPGVPTSFNGVWRVVGDLGAARWDGNALTCTLEQMDSDGHGPGWTELQGPTAPELGCPAEVAAIGDYHGACLWEVLDALAQGRRAPTDIYDNVRSLALVLAAADSAREGRWVELSS